MAIGILGKKLGMTQVYDPSGERVPVTVIEAGPCDVIRFKTQEADGYEAVIMGFGSAKEKRTPKPQLGEYKKAAVAPRRFVREFKIKSQEERNSYAQGQPVKVDRFSAGECVDVTGTTIGKGFQGGVRRWNWRGGDETHGSMTHRRPGSIGASSFPSRVFPGHHMPGHMGHRVRTVENVEVVDVMVDKNLLIVKGQVPGPRNEYLVIEKALKRPRRKERIEQVAKKLKAKARVKKQ
ncbi:MAG: 50S ribosomal protein L3 [Candidatus Omnitrophica bacterium]|nr:50S ribosomal protein L3 [Candidatus Omnitrophota bacterium]